MEESVKKEIMKQAQKILNKRLKDYHILTKDNTYILDDFHVKLSKIEKLFLKS